MEPGQTAEVELALLFAPENPYTEVEPGATFTVREGSKVVGYGEILSRREAAFSLPLHPASR